MGIVALILFSSWVTAAGASTTVPQWRSRAAEQSPLDPHEVAGYSGGYVDGAVSNDVQYDFNIVNYIGLRSGYPMFTARGPGSSY